MNQRGNLPSPAGSIVFTETMDWTFKQVQRALEELASTDALRGANALFLTALTERTDRVVRLYPELRDPEKIIEICKFASDLLQLPVLYGFPLGHGAYKLTLPQGVKCLIDPADGSISIFEPPVL